MKKCKITLRDRENLACAVIPGYSYDYQGVTLVVHEGMSPAFKDGTATLRGIGGWQVSEPTTGKSISGRVVAGTRKTALDHAALRIEALGGVNALKGAIAAKTPKAVV